MILKGDEGSKGMKQGRGRKNRRACMIPPPPHPQDLKGEWGEGITDARLFFLPLPFFIPFSSHLHPLPSPFKISPYLHLNSWSNSWIQLSTLTCMDLVCILSFFCLTAKVLFRSFIFVISLSIRKPPPPY